MICLNNGTATYNNTSDGCECECVSEETPEGNITYVGDHCEYRFPGVCIPSPCGNGTCVELTQTLHDCACDFGFQGENCDHVCNTTISGRLDISIVIDTSGSLTSAPNKDQVLMNFTNNLANMYDTINQVKIGLTSFSESAVLEMPLDFYNQLELQDGVSNMTWQGSFTNITSGVETALNDMDTTDGVDDVMILITDGFQSTNTTLMFQMIDQAKAEGVRLIALGFFGDFAFYSPNLYLMTNEVYHAANYAELLAIDNTIFETICSDGVIPDGVAAGESASNFEKTFTDVNATEIFMMQAAHDFFDLNGDFPSWIQSIVPGLS